MGEISRKQATAEAEERRDRPKNLSMSITIEAAELMERFQWLTTEEAQAATQNPVQASRSSCALIVRRMPSPRGQGEGSGQA